MDSRRWARHGTLFDRLPHRDPHVDEGICDANDCGESTDSDILNVETQLVRDCVVDDPCAKM